MSDPWNKTPDQEGFGRKGLVVSPSDSTDLDPIPKAITVVAAGSLSILPVGNEDVGDTIDYASVPVGFMPPYIVRRVMATGTSATVATVDG